MNLIASRRKTPRLSSSACLLTTLLIAACGGGGGNTMNAGGGGSGTPLPGGSAQGATLGVVASSLMFAAAGPTSGEPPAQTAAAVINGYAGNVTGNLYIIATASGDAIQSINRAMSSPTMETTALIIDGAGMVTTNPMPDTSGGGRFNTVVATSVARSNSGSSTTSALTVSYSIVPVSPRNIGSTTVSGNIRIRACLGSSSCANGELPGSPQDIAVTYTVGSAAMTTSALSSTVDTSAVVAFGSSESETVDASAQSAQTLSVDTNGLNEVSALMYDASKGMLIVGLDYADRARNQLMTFTRQGTSWIANAIGIPNLTHLAPSAQRDVILVLTDSALLEVNVASQAILRTITPPQRSHESIRLQRVALANDGRAVITTQSALPFSPAYRYEVATTRFEPLNNASLLAGVAAEVVADSDAGHVLTRVLDTGPEHRDAYLLDYDALSGVVSRRLLSGDERVALEARQRSKRKTLRSPDDKWWFSADVDGITVAPVSAP
jgi:hypothetical protein